MENSTIDTQRDTIPQWRKDMLGSNVTVLTATDHNGNQIVNYTGTVKDVYKTQKPGQVPVTYMVIGEKVLNMNRSYHIK